MPLAKRNWLVVLAANHVECCVETEANEKPCWVEVTKADWTQWLSKVGCVWDDTLQRFKGPALQPSRRSWKMHSQNEAKCSLPQSCADQASMWPRLLSRVDSEGHAGSLRELLPYFLTHGTLTKCQSLRYQGVGRRVIPGKVGKLYWSTTCWWVLSNVDLPVSQE